jgi:hypothetical protein
LARLTTFGKNAAGFFLSLNPQFSLPKDFDFLLPYENPDVQKVTKEFFRKFYDDTRKRIFIIGINPGRFGAGTTGIAFTDPIRLESECGIRNDFVKKPELSSSFIYEMIHKTGGVKTFYDEFFLTAICPIGFVKNGKNINYYDDKTLLKSSQEFIEDSLSRQVLMGASKTAICLGEGKNYSYVNAVNQKLKLFDEILPLAHPRFIMQYKRKKLNEYLDMYIRTLEKAVKKTAT